MPHVGNQAPDFTLPDERGNMHTLSQYRERQNVLLAFYGYDWCDT